MKCPNCGSENAEGKRFCGDCGAILPQPTPSTYPGRSRSRERMLLGFIVILVVALILMASFTIVPSLLKPSRSAPVHLYVKYWGIGYHEIASFSVYYDGRYATDNVITGNWSMTDAGDSDVSFVVRWHGEELHMTIITIMIQGYSFSKTISVRDGIQCSETFELNP